MYALWQCCFFSWRTLVCILLISVGSGVAQAKQTLPAVLQAALLARIFQADKTISGAANPAEKKLLVVHSASSTEFARALVEALGPTQMVTQDLDAQALERAPAGISAVYVVDAEDVEAVHKFCIERGALSITGETTSVERGLISVGLVANAYNHPEVVIHVKQVSLERHVLAPALLQLARVVGG